MLLKQLYECINSFPLHMNKQCFLLPKLGKKTLHQVQGLGWSRAECSSQVSKWLHKVLSLPRNICHFHSQWAILRNFLLQEINKNHTLFEHKFRFLYQKSCMNLINNDSAFSSITLFYVSFSCILLFLTIGPVKVLAIWYKGLAYYFTQTQKKLLEYSGFTFKIICRKFYLFNAASIPG